MKLIFNLAQAIAHQVEYIFESLVSLLIEELIHGERNYAPKTAILAALAFVIFAIFSFYMEIIVELYTVIGIASFVLCQLNNIDTRNLHEKTKKEVMTTYFHESCMVLFLLILTSLLPKAGHFIMFWIGPSLGVQVPTLMLDLSLSGIWSLFAIDIQFFDWINIPLFIISIIFSFYSWQKSSSR